MPLTKEEVTKIVNESVDWTPAEELEAKINQRLKILIAREIAIVTPETQDRAAAFINSLGELNTDIKEFMEIVSKLSMDVIANGLPTVVRIELADMKEKGLI